MNDTIIIERCNHCGRKKVISLRDAQTNYFNRDNPNYKFREPKWI